MALEPLRAFHPGLAAPSPQSRPLPQLAPPELLQLNAQMGQLFRQQGSGMEQADSSQAPKPMRPKALDPVQTLVQQALDAGFLSVSQAFQRAFWINTYNALVPALAAQRGLKKSVRQDLRFFSRPALDLKLMPPGLEHAPLSLSSTKSVVLSLNDIEHGILRCRRRRPTGLLRPFALASDPRRCLVLLDFDPRIHFALNCGARSCPPIRYYEPHKLEDQLELAEKAFAASDFVVASSERTIRCSKIFSWYASDFPGRYLDDPGYRGWRIEFSAYDWSLSAVSD